MKRFKEDNDEPAVSGLSDNDEDEDAEPSQLMKNRPKQRANKKVPKNSRQENPPKEESKQPNPDPEPAQYVEEEAKAKNKAKRAKAGKKKGKSRNRSKPSNLSV